MNEAVEDARRYVRRKRTFYTVLGIWVPLSLMWFAIDMLDDSSSWWFYWPMLGTGIAVAITGVVLLGIGGLFGADWERREIDKDLRRRANEPGGSLRAQQRRSEASSALGLTGDRLLEVAPRT